MLTFTKRYARAHQHTYIHITYVHSYLLYMCIFACLTKVHVYVSIIHMHPHMHFAVHKHKRLHVDIFKQNSF